MKFDARAVERFLADPGRCRVVLLHGPDAGLVRERGAALTLLVAGSLDDPFRVAELERDGIGRIAEEMGARPMTGGRRVVRVRDVTDAAAVAVQAALASGGEGLVVLEAGELPGRSKLKTLVEGSSEGAAIVCYGEQGAELGQTVAATLAGLGVRASPEAMAFLCEQLGYDRAATRQEIGKLALYVAPGCVVDIQAAIAVVGDMAGLQLEDALYAATEGEVGLADRALGLALSEGVTPVSALRVGLMHLQRLARIQIAVQGGQSATEAVRAARPPVFFRRQGSMVRACGLWSAESLARACGLFWDGEQACKRTGAPAVVLCRQAVLSVARRAAAARRG